MDTSTGITYIIIIVLLVKLSMASDWYSGVRCEGMVSRPTHETRERMTEAVMVNKHIFVNDRMGVPSIRSVMPWMDAVVFEDLRKLTRENRFDQKNIYQVLG
jgi:hypothetical protein